MMQNVVASVEGPGLTAVGELACVSKARGKPENCRKIEQPAVESKHRKPANSACDLIQRKRAINRVAGWKLKDSGRRHG